MRALDCPSGTTAADMEQCRRWSARFLSAAQDLPLSFRYDGARVRGIPAAWNPVVSRRRIDANLVETVFKGTEPQGDLHLRVECLEYLDYPVVEWTVWLSCVGKGPTGLIEDLLALDENFAGVAPVVHHCNGDFYSEDGYTPLETPLASGEVLAFAPRGGRPCDGAFPYFRVAFSSVGLSLAVGWPGQWSASFARTDEGVHVTAGQQTTHLRLRPGERIRTPRMTVMGWVGEPPRAVNLWRRWYRDHVLPRPDGAPLSPKLACFCNDGGEEFTQASEENQLRFMEAFSRKGLAYDVWWIDAGWYPCADGRGERHWVQTGTWEPDPERFPRGLGPVSRLAAATGAGLLLWFEPERVMRGSALDREHPQWLLDIPAPAGAGAARAETKLLNLGDAQCRQWLTDHVCRLIEDNGVRVYRQDFNLAPLPYWQQGEAADRRGVRENLHVQGYLQFWDDLLARNPGLWIDSCASGGRRNDLETMRRSVSLHYTDYGYGIPAVKLAFHHTLYAWLPYFKDSTLLWDTLAPDGDKWFDAVTDPFGYHCGMAPMLTLACDIRRQDYDYAQARRLVAIWRRAAGLLLYGDYHPLTPLHRGADRWVVWQFDLAAGGEGLVQGIRHRDCGEETMTVRLQALCPDADYVLDNPETGTVVTFSGRTLREEGFTFTLPRRSGAIWFYRRRDAAGT